MRNGIDYTTEAEVVGSCLNGLELMGIEAWRNNTGALKDRAGKRYIRFGKPGSSDILGILKDGRFLAVECKRPVGGRITELQQNFINMINENGGVGLIVHIFDELYDGLKSKGALKNE